LRANFVNARIARVKLQEKIVAPHLPGDQSPQIVLNAFPLLIEARHKIMMNNEGSLATERFY
jgi:hypothetical protein